MGLEQPALTADSSWPGGIILAVLPLEALIPLPLPPVPDADPDGVRLENHGEVGVAALIDRNTLLPPLTRSVERDGWVEGVRVGGGVG